MVEKIPSLKCDKCGSHQVVMMDQGINCEECIRITANVTKLFPFMENEKGDINEVE